MTTPPKARTIPGGRQGPCWVAHCGGSVYWPPPTATAQVQCDDTLRGPHTATVTPATPKASQP